MDTNLLEIKTNSGIAMFQPRRDYYGFRPQRTGTGWLIPPGVFVVESQTSAVLRWEPSSGLTQHDVSELRDLLTRV